MKKEFKLEIQGLRALAVVCVLVFHLNPILMPGGFLGVDVFFVISGYLIYSSILNDINKKTFSFQNFWERRARRILPAVIVVLFVTQFVSLFWFPSSSVKDLAESALSAQLFVSNIYFWKTTDYFAEASSSIPLIHLWSLGVEEQFYLFFPFLAIFLHKRLGFLLLMTGLLGSFFIAEYLVHQMPVATFYLLPTRAWELLCGVLIVRLQHSNSVALLISTGVVKKCLPAITFISFAALLLSLIFLSEDFKQPSAWTLIPIFATMILITGPRDPLSSYVLRSRLFIFFGGISYSLYLWHQPIITFTRFYIEINWVVGVLLFLIISLLAWLTKIFIEDKFRNPKKFKRSVFVAFISGFWAVTVIFSVITLSSNGFKKYRSDLDVLVSDAVETGHGRKACWDKLVARLRWEDACIWGDLAETPTYAVIGDSHAAALVTGLQAVGLEYGVSGLDLTLGSCPTFFDGKLQVRDSGQDKCDSLREKFFGALESDALPKNIILSARYPVYIEGTFPFNKDKKVVWEFKEKNKHKDLMLETIQKTRDKIVASGRNAIFIYPTPELEFNVPKLMFKASKLGILDQDTGSILRADYLTRMKSTDNILRNVAAFDRTYLIETEDLFCSKAKNLCFAHKNDVPLYYDRHHVSKYVALEIARKIIGRTDY